MVLGLKAAIRAALERTGKGDITLAAGTTH
jgi:hypothetical protein